MVSKGCSHKCTDHGETLRKIRGGTFKLVELYEEFSTGKSGSRSRTKRKRRRNKDDG